MVKNLPVNPGDIRDTFLILELGRSKQEVATHSSILAGAIHEQMILVGYIPQGHKESHKTEATEHTQGKSNLCKLTSEGSSTLDLPEKYINHLF